MKILFTFLLIFPVICCAQGDRTDTIRYFEYVHINNRVLEVEITYREDFKKPRMKILAGSYVGNDILLKEDLKVYLSRRKLRKIVEEAKKIPPNQIIPDWEYEMIILDGTSTELYFSNWFETNKPLELNFANPESDTEKRGLSQYYKLFKLIEKAVEY